ncbi:radical SAM family heme chaperone HemW [Kamptonema cortianum]|nr:radical SAM family heme chaperone HemW [Kamptonema cortianum]
MSTPPFCPSKCGYCDFNSYAMEGEIVERTVQATIAEIKRSRFRGRPAKTIFFGGGTPTYLSSSQLTGILEAVVDAHPPVPGAEITSEGNPGTVDIPKFADMRQAGFNRISLGAQSFNTGDLIRLGRVHEASHIGKAIAAARKAQFENINIDLMFALPGQSIKAWASNLNLAIQMETEHLSLYCLTIEPNTRYYRLNLRGMLNLPNDDQQVQMYDLAVETCTKAGLSQYEISNFAKPGLESQHNLAYWRNEEYLAYGPGAVGCFHEKDQTTRYTNIKHPQAYSDAVENDTNLWCEQDTLTSQDERMEKIMMGLRLNQGLDPTNLNIDQAGLKKVTQAGWVTQTPNKITLTPTGRHFCSEVALALI